MVAVPDDVRPAGHREPARRQSTRWKIKRFSNDELRQKFVDATVPQAHYLGLTLPDPALRFDEASGALGVSARSTGRSSSSVLAGNGPCNRDRLARAPQGA